MRAVQDAGGCLCRYQIYVGTDIAICMEGVAIPERACPRPIDAPPSTILLQQGNDDTALDGKR